MEGADCGYQYLHDIIIIITLDTTKAHQTQHRHVQRGERCEWIECARTDLLNVVATNGATWAIAATINDDNPNAYMEGGWTW